MFIATLILLLLISVAVWSAGKSDSLTASYDGQELKIRAHITVFVISAIMIITVVGIMSGKIGRTELRYPASGWRIENEIIFRNGHADTTYVVVKK